MTVLEAIQRSGEFLGKKGVESPRLNAELLLAEVLRVPRMRLYLDFERVLAEAEVNDLRVMVVRRSQREPLQHILGRVNFCGLDFKVTKEVLIPRPETELLAELAWKFLAEMAPEPRVFDYGTGSGCLAITLAVRIPAAQVLAVDISAAALEVARENAVAHQVAERVRFAHGDALACLERGLTLVVGNPPYIARGAMAGLPAEVRDYDPSLALDGGVDGLDHYRRIAMQAGPSVVAGGKVMLEFGDGQGGAITEIFQKQNWIVEALVEDYNRQPRILVAAPGPDGRS